MPDIIHSLAYSTDSAGMHPSHTLPMKLRAIADAGFQLAELAFPDIEAYAEQEFSNYQQIDESGRGDVDVLVRVGEMVKALCTELGISILAVHP